MSAIGPVRIDGLLTGRALPFGPQGEPSAIDKHLLTQPAWLGLSGIAGDEQGDPLHHGGPDKALHHYPGEHYDAWRRDLPQLPAQRWQAGGFGENLCTIGLTERDLCIGDVVRLGGAVIQISQARQPCWKLNVRFGLDDMARQVQASGRTGWYYRVLEAGEVAPGDAWELIERPCALWPLARLLHYFYIAPLDRDALAAIAELGVLAPSWRKIAAQRLLTGQVEDSHKRLDTPRTSQS